MAVFKHAEQGDGLGKVYFFEEVSYAIELVVPEVIDDELVHEIAVDLRVLGVDLVDVASEGLDVTAQQFIALEARQLVDSFVSFGVDRVAGCAGDGVLFINRDTFRSDLCLFLILFNINCVNWVLGNKGTNFWILNCWRLGVKSLVEAAT